MHPQNSFYFGTGAPKVLAMDHDGLTWPGSFPEKMEANKNKQLHD
jgi:hypothetical protein